MILVEIIEDMRDECGKYGSVLRCVVSAHQPTENQVSSTLLL